MSGSFHPQGNGRLSSEFKEFYLAEGFICYIFNAFYLEKSLESRENKTRKIVNKVPLKVNDLVSISTLEIIQKKGQ